jgi:hypothetical protein
MLVARLTWGYQGFAGKHLRWWGTFVPWMCLPEISDTFPGDTMGPASVSA